MLSVAQAVHHPETPGSASKHSVRPWSSERPNMLKRRKTEPDCCVVDKKLAKSSIENLTKSLNFNNPEITLTLIHKNNNQNDFKELLHGKIKTPPVTEEEDLNINDKTQEEIKDSDRIPTNISPVVLYFLEKSEEIQLTKLGSNKNVKLINQNEINNSISEESVENPSESIEKSTDTSKQTNNFLDSNSIELSEVTIEPYPSFNKSKIIESSPPSPILNESKTPKFVKTQTKLAKAQELLKKKEQSMHRSFISSSGIETDESNLKAISPEAKQVFTFDIKLNFSEEIIESDSDSSNCMKQNNLFEEESEHHVPVSSISDYEPFNFGVSCDNFYSNNKDRPYYATGFPNPPGENRCWTNATLQALFTLPIINKLDTLGTVDYSKLIKSLIDIKTFWCKGNTNCNNFDQSFSTFKEELSTLDKLYSSKAQQDVSEFVMNLLNFIKTEFENLSVKEIHNNEIENIPNNEQDSIPRSQNSTNDSTKRLPLADISSLAGQLRNNNVPVHNGQQDISNVKSNSSTLKLKQENKIEMNSNPIDEYFSLFMIENYVCDNCSKQRQQKVENLILFIDLPSEDHGTTANLVDLINTTYALEHRYMTCESCNHDVHSMVTKFKKLPKILIVQVKRYEMTKDGMITKKCTLVEIPKLLKLDSLVISNNEEFNDFPEYKPICIISHIGDNIDSGHYISFVKHEDNWFYYDDMNVKLLSDDDVFKCIQSNAYVIFFEDTRFKENDITVNQKIKKESITC